MRITHEMLLKALTAGADKDARLRAWVGWESPSVCLDGWFDLAKTAETLNAELLRQAQTSKPGGLLDINMTAWEET